MSEHQTPSSSKQEDPNPEPSQADYLSVVEGSFAGFTTRAVDRLNDLEQDISAADEPHWNEKLAEEIIDLALTTAALASGEMLAAMVAKKVGKSLGKKVAHELLEHPATEVAKELFQEGVKDGLKATSKALLKGPGSPLQLYIRTQKQAVQDAFETDRVHFITVTRHTSIGLADFLAAECSIPNQKTVADEHYAKARDGWISFVAQATFGSRRHGPGMPTVTNLNTPEERQALHRGDEDAMQKWAENGPTFNGPTYSDGAGGNNPGVLTVLASVPLQRGDGKPKVIHAYLNGMNERVRGAYQERDLSEIPLPRYIECLVKDLHSFSVSVDEAGSVSVPSEYGRKWLAANYDPSRLAENGESEGTQGDMTSNAANHLLADLRVGEIEKET